MLCIKSKRAIAQLGRAPRLHVRQCFFFSEESIMESKGLILLINRCLTPPYRERPKQENNSLTKD